MGTEMEVIIGSYEEFLLGYKLDDQRIKQTFADKSHTGALKCVAVHKNWIATGGTDDRIFVYDMRSRKQSQIILSHTGTVNTLDFTPDGTHLISGADDGSMICTRLNTWCIEADWKKSHNGTPVTHISCHPSGKLALSLGGDLVLRTWNLVKGRVAYKTNLKSRGTLGYSPDCLSWSPNGEHFTISGQRIVEFWSIQLADVLQTQKTPSKPTSVCWISDETCLIGLEDGKIVWVTLKSESEKTVIIEAHTSRVKAMAFSKDTLVTVSSSGELKMWQVKESTKKIKEITALHTNCRPTCLALLDLVQFDSNYVLSETTSIATTTANAKKTSIPTKASNHSHSVVTIEYDNSDDSNEFQLKEEKSDEQTSEGDEESNEDSKKNDDARGTYVKASKRKNQDAMAKQIKRKKGKVEQSLKKKSKPN